MKRWRPWTVVEPAVRLFRRLRSFRARVRGSRAATAVAAILLLAVLGLAVPALPRFEPRWPWLIASALLTIPGLSLNILEYWVGGRIAGVRVPLVDAARVSVIGSASNFLPIPGGAMVRSFDLARRGVDAGRAVSTTIVLGLAWVAAATAMFGGIGTYAGFDSSPPFIAAGAVLVSVLFFLLARLGASPRWAIPLLAIELVFVVVRAARFLCAVFAIGLGATVLQAAGFVVADVVTAAIGIVPGGLGLRELLVGALGPWLELEASTGVVATAVDRFVGIVMLTAFSLLLLGRLPMARQPPREGSPPDASAAAQGAAWEARLGEPGRDDA